MAKMYPKALPTDKALVDASLSTISAAEREMFDSLRDCVSDDFTVFHGRALQGWRKGGGVVDKEIDFIIAHPDHGLLVIEAKGGRIVIDGASNGWVSVNRMGQPNEIKDPFKQAKEATYTLLEYLRSGGDTALSSVPIWYGAAFPDTDVPNALGPNAPREIILDRHDLLAANIQSELMRMYGYYHMKGPHALGNKGIRALILALAPDWTLLPGVTTDFDIEAAKFLQLTEEQYSVLDGMDHKPRVLIAGCAGSGKTLLAVEKARRLAQNGNNVLLTCFNKALAAWLNKQYQIEGVTIQHFHSLAVTTIQQVTGTRVASLSDLDMDEEEYWSHFVPNELANAVADMPDSAKYDAIIVDEGQDFREDWWIPLQLLAKDPDACVLYIFYDAGQRIFSNDDFPIPEVSYYLTRNLRSTYEIGLSITPYYLGQGKMLPGGPVSNRPPESIKARKGESEIKLLGRILDRLAKERIASGDIAFLTVHNSSSVWQHDMKIGNYTLVRTERKPKPGDITTRSIYQFKGLESPVIILAEFGELDMGDRADVLLLYVGLSRAKNHLIILGKLPVPVTA